jgi:acyl carrier protein
MTHQEISDRILEIVCNKLKIEKKEITLESTFSSFGANSLDLVEVIIEIEKDFKRNIPDNITLEFYDIKSVSFEYFIISLTDYIDMVMNRNTQCNFFALSYNC